MRRGVLAATAHGGITGHGNTDAVAIAGTDKHDPTSAGFLGDKIMENGNENRGTTGPVHQNQASVVETSAMALDLDLFDPDEDD